MNTRCFPEQTAEIRPYVQQQRGLSSLLAGVAFVPMMLLGASLTPLSARIVERAGPVAAFGLEQLREGAASAGLREATSPGGSK
jgi:MFS transporter, DHA2 family, methylenomycin A resistance protein